MTEERRKKGGSKQASKEEKNKARTLAFLLSEKEGRKEESKKLSK